MYSGDTGPYGQGNRPTGLYGYENHTLGAVAASAGAALPVSHRPGSGGGDAGLSLLPSQQQPTYGYAPPTAYPPTAYTYDYSHMGTAPALAGGGGGGGERGHRFCAVRLRGLPFGVHEHEIASFLGLDPIDILLVQRGGRVIGEAYVVLTHPREVEMARQKDKAYMGSRYIEVFEVRKFDYYRAIASTMADRERSEEYPSGAPPPLRGGHSGGGYKRDRSRSPTHHHHRASASHPDHGPSSKTATSSILKMRGLPYTAREQDVVDFFGQLVVENNDVDVDDDNNNNTNRNGNEETVELTTEHVMIVGGGGGRPSGMAFVQFPSLQAASVALQKDRKSMGHRYIELFPSDEEERKRHKAAV